MLNQFVVIGRLQEIKESGVIVITQQSKFKNEEGIYETIENSFQLSGSILESTIEYIKKGDLIGLKGIIRNNELVVEKITFLSSRKEEE